MLDLGNNIKLIDGYDLFLANRTGSYVLLADEITLIETGPSISIPYIKEGLKKLNIQLSDVKHIIVTHIHLDHSGGLGLLMKDCPNALCYVHPKGARHLIDPSRLILGARAVYGDEFDKLFDPIVPIPENKVIIKEDGDTLQIANDRILTFYHTKGHADHHFSIHDSLSNGMFTGDTIGVSYDEVLKEFGIKFYLPSTSPNQFRPDEMLASLERIKNLQVDAVYFGHYSISRDFDEVYRQIKERLPLFLQIGQKAIEENLGAEWAGNELYSHFKQVLMPHQIPEDHIVYEFLKLDTSVSAMGVIDYLTKQKGTA